jgi:hypothetical protein
MKMKEFFGSKELHLKWAKMIAWCDYAIGTVEWAKDVVKFFHKINSIMI